MRVLCQQLPDLRLAGVALLLLAALELVAGDGGQVAEWRIRGVGSRLSEGFLVMCSAPAANAVEFISLWGLIPSGLRSA